MKNATGGNPSSANSKQTDAENGSHCKWNLTAKTVTVVGCNVIWIRYGSQLLSSTVFLRVCPLHLPSHMRHLVLAHVYKCIHVALLESAHLLGLSSTPSWQFQSLKKNVLIFCLTCFFCISWISSISDAAEYADSSLASINRSCSAAIIMACANVDMWHHQKHGEFWSMEKHGRLRVKQRFGSTWSCMNLHTQISLNRHCGRFKLIMGTCDSVSHNFNFLGAMMCNDVQWQS